MLEEQGWFEDAPQQTVVFDELTETIPNSATAGALMGSFLDFRTVVGEAMQRVINGEDVDTALMDAKELAISKLQEYNANL